MIGCYIHHQGLGHLHRSLAWAQQLGEPVTGLSSLERPKQWPGPWVPLEPDWDPPPEAPVDPTVGGALHWVPAGHPGLRARMHRISEWIAQAEPELLVVDVSVEVALLARLHGVAVITVALPGDRRDDAHRLCYTVSSAVVGFWPATAEDILQRSDEGPQLHAIGALSRYDAAAQPVPEAHHTAPARPMITVLIGAGGGGISTQELAAVETAIPGTELCVLGGETGIWDPNPWTALAQADLVIVTAGQNSVAEVAASRTPAVVLAQDRPYAEQQHMHQGLHRGPWPVVTAPREIASPGAWRSTLQAAFELDGQDWAGWNDGQAAARFCELLQELRR
ncbi:glycosyltransferase family 28 protein [Nesterenkonia ebinurensis]|uniref:glycosyl transferase n=1 Tax=Nesterenkonia ebinurensis TaxID=2608252 RepID=UPI00123CFBE6|nr:glycosyl transferase [Nesterenkonia ebinurensis]